MSVPLQTLLGGYPSPAVQPYVAILLPLVLTLGPLWPIIFLTMCNKRGIQLHQLVCGVG
jgi:hypothetical protein